MALAQVALSRPSARTVRSPTSSNQPGRYPLGPALLTGAGLVAWMVAVTSADGGAMGNLGLITVLGWPFLVAVVAVAGALAWSLAGARPRPLLPVLALVLVLFATAPAIEPIARLPTAWVHAGFIEYIAAHGRVLPNYDARFSWPGFFSLGAVLDTITGQHDPIVFLRWAPVVFELSYLAPLRVIARSTLGPGRAGWIGTALFYAVNWTDQDYFSPQALNLFFFLVVVASVLAFWRTRAAQDVSGRWIVRWRRRIGQVDGTLGTRRQVGLEIVLVVLFAACVASHQFTPYAMVLALVGCVATRRLPGLELPAILAVMALAWLSFATFSFWSGHLSLLFSGTGSVGTTLGQNVSKRVVGAPAHRLVVDLRLLLTGALVALAAMSALKRRGQSRTLEVLAAVPFLLILGGSYGGEALIRCFLFALPFLSLLAGGLLVRLVEPVGTSVGRRRASVLALTAILSVTSIWLTAARGGNDSYESFTSGERAAVLAVYRVAQPGQRLASTTAATDQLPWRDQGLGVWHYVDPTDDASATVIARSLLHQRANWVILTTNEEHWGELVAGLPVGWQTSVAADLHRAGYTVYLRSSTSEIMRSPSS